MHLYFFKILNQYFNRLSKEKINNGIFIGPDIKKLLSNEHFRLLLDEWQKSAYDSLLSVIKHVLYPSQDIITNQEEIVTGLINNYVNMGCNYSPKMHYIHCHFKHLIAKQAGVSDEHGEKMHQTMRACETWYDGKQMRSMLSDYVWSKCS